jgi:hypothetical protein
MESIINSVKRINEEDVKKSEHEQKKEWLKQRRDDISVTRKFKRKKINQCEDDTKINSSSVDPVPVTSKNQHHSVSSGSEESYMQCNTSNNQ